MARRLRFAPPGYWLHLTQRGNNRQRTFTSDADREFFLHLLDTYSAEREVRIAGYAVMTNHFHLIAVGDRPDAISLFMMDVNGHYATYRNATQRTRGHLWQGKSDHPRKVGPSTRKVGPSTGWHDFPVSRAIRAIGAIAGNRGHRGGGEDLTRTCARSAS